MENNNEVLVKVQNISKKFSLNLKTGLKYGALDIIKSTFGIKISKELRPNEFWAVKDVSFELRRGECIGLIGHNGAGKSTLLKVLNGLYAPDKGQITMKGKIGALIELGAGFNPILTGRENIYNNGAILGFTKQEIDERIDSIIEFSEIEKFIDSPVQNYSSGMKVRLGFAIASHLEPDILIIDEVLAVGDMGFVLKCFKKIDQLLPNTAMIFVSHNMQQVSRICNQIILMDHGQVQYQGTDTAKGIDLYFKKFDNNHANVVLDDGTIQLLDYKIEIANGTLNKYEDFNIYIKAKLNNTSLNKVPGVYLEFKDKDLRPIAGVVKVDYPKIEGNIIEYFITVKNSLFTMGNYIIDLGMSSGNTPIYRMNNIFAFSVSGDKTRWIPIELEHNFNIKQTQA